MFNSWFDFYILFVTKTHLYTFILNYCLKIQHNFHFKYTFVTLKLFIFSILHFLWFSSYICDKKKSIHIFPTNSLRKWKIIIVLLFVSYDRIFWFYIFLSVIIEIIHPDIYFHVMITVSTNIWVNYDIIYKIIFLKIINSVLCFMKEYLKQLNVGIYYFAIAHALILWQFYFKHKFDWNVETRLILFFFLIKLEIFLYPIN